MLKSSAKYAFGLKFARLMPLNDDLKIPTSLNIVGGAGPFDFSGVTLISAIPIKIKIDNGAEVISTVDLTAAVSQSAVTAAEVVTALNATFTAETLDLSVSIDATNDNRLKIESTAGTPPTWVQIYGQFAKIIKLGQGFGMKFVKTDTLQSASKTPTLKDEETITVTDASGIDTEVISDGYRKGSSSAIVDTADDWEMLALIAGGDYDEDEESYETPTSETEKIYFFIEAYYAKYTQGSNKEADLVSYVRETYRSCKGSVGDRSNAREFLLGNYTITSTSYKDENGNLLGDTKLEELTIPEFDALDLWNV